MNILVRPVIPPQLAVENGQRFVLYCVDWDFYEGLLRLLGNRHVKITYDRGVIELMTTSRFHEFFAGRLGNMLEALAQEWNVRYVQAGATTFNRRDLDRGLEPDRSYFIQNWERVRGTRTLDLTIDPPPDVTIEMEVTRSALDRMGIYAALGVPEVWRCDGEQLFSYQLQSNGEYTPHEHSLAFPTLEMNKLLEFLQQYEDDDDTTLLTAFRAWARKTAVAQKKTRRGK